MSKMIELSGPAGAGKFAIVDDQDYEALCAFKWFLACGQYANRGAIGPHSQRRGQVTRMHRIIMGLAVGDKREVDHRNLNGLDNRRANLRVCTRGENQQNLRGRGSASIYRGVTLDRRWNRWRARVTVGGVTHCLGDYENELDAARAAHEGRLRLMPFAVEEMVA